MRVTLADVTKGFGAHTVLSEVTLGIGPRSRIGLVGPNGVGKTTLLRLLAGLDEPDGGSVVRAPASLAVGYLPQETDARSGETLLDYLARRRATQESLTGALVIGTLSHARGTCGHAFLPPPARARTSPSAPAARRTMSCRVVPASTIPSRCA